MARLGVNIVGDAVGLKAALGQSTAAVQKFAAETESANVRVAESFKGVSTAALQTQVAEDKLAVATNRYGAGSLGAAQATLAYRRQVEQLSASHIAAARSIGRGLTTYVTAPVALLGYEAVKMGVNFQKQMLLLQTQAGASAGEVQRLSKAVLGLAPTVGMGPEQLAQGLYHLESLGLRGSRALQTLKISAYAAGMGVANLEDVTTALGGVVVTGIKGAQNYQQAMNTLTATVGAGNMRFEDLAASIGNVAPAAAAAGVSLPELGAAMATLTDRGFSADEAATRLRMSLSLIQSPSKKAQKALADMGVNANSLGAMLRQPGGLLKVLQTLHDAIGRVGATRGNRDLLAGFGGGRSGLGIQTLVQSLDSSISSYDQKLKQVAADELKAAAAHKAFLDSPSFKLHQDLAQIETDLTKIGITITPTIVKMADGAAKIAGAFGKLPGPIKTDVGVIVGLLAVGGPLLLTIAGVVRAIGTIRGAFGRLPVAATTSLTTVDGELATTGGAANVAALKVGALRTALTNLAALGTVTLTVQILEQFIPKGVEKKGQSILDKGGGGFLGHLPLLGPVAQAGAYYGRDFRNAITGHSSGQASRVPSRYSGNQDEMEAYLSGLQNNAFPFPFNDPNFGADYRAYLAGRRAEGNPVGGKKDRGIAGRSRSKGGVGSVQSSSMDTFSLPYRIQLAMAKAEASGRIAQIDAADQLARDWITKMIDQHRLVGQALIDAYNELATLSRKTTSAGRSAAAAARRQAAAAKKAQDAAIQRQEERILGLGPGGAPTVPGAAALRQRERDILNKALASALAAGAEMPSPRRGPKAEKNYGYGRIQKLGGSSSSEMKAQLARITRETAHMSLDQIVKEVEHVFGKNLPHATLVSLEKINEVLKMKFLPPDVKDNIRQRLQQIEQTLAAGLSSINRTASNYVAEPADKIVAGLKLTRQQKLILEQRIAQAEAHHGSVPRGVGVLGQVVIHVNGARDPAQTAKEVAKHLQRHSKRTVAQTRGRHGGTGMGIT